VAGASGTDDLPDKLWDEPTDRQAGLAVAPATLTSGDSIVGLTPPVTPVIATSPPATRRQFAMTTSDKPAVLPRGAAPGTYNLLTCRPGSATSARPPLSRSSLGR
jgi:hypothetical protein